MKDFQLPVLEKTNAEYSNIQSMEKFFSQALINQDGGGWYKNKNYDPEKWIEDDPSTHAYKWFDTLGEVEGWEYIGGYYITKNEESTQMIIHLGKTDKVVKKLNNGKLDMIVTSDGVGAFVLKDKAFLDSDVFELYGGAEDFNDLTARLVDADIKFGTVMLVGHGTYDYSSERFMRIGADRYVLDDTLFAALKDTNFANSFDASSNLILYQCTAARATESGLKEDKLVYQKLSDNLGGASIFVPYGAVLPNPFVNKGNTTGDRKSAKEYFKFQGIKQTETIKKIIKNNELWLKVQNNQAFHLYGFRLNLIDDQLEITIEESKEAVPANFK